MVWIWAARQRCGWNVSGPRQELLCLEALWRSNTNLFIDECRQLSEDSHVVCMWGLMTVKHIFLQNVSSGFACSDICDIKCVLVLSFQGSSVVNGHLYLTKSYKIQTLHVKNCHKELICDCLPCAVYVFDVNFVSCFVLWCFLNPLILNGKFFYRFVSWDYNAISPCVLYIMHSAPLKE